VENPICIYCLALIDLGGDYILMTDSGEGVWHAHIECSCLAITLASAALRQPNLIETSPLGGKLA
jgi:hypothetical protein